MDALLTDDRTAPPSFAVDSTRSALEFAHSLLHGPPHGGQATLPELLRDLAASFDAAAAGLTASTEGSPQTLVRVGADGREPTPCRRPWDDAPELLAGLAASAVGLPARAADGRSWLLTSVWAPAGAWLLWVEDDTGREWSRGEAAVLPLIGQALARLAAADGEAGCWARALERARVEAHCTNAARLTGKLAHDFGNVLTGILGFTELALLQLPGDSLPRRYATEVWESAQQGARWVQKLRRFAPRRAGEFAPASLAAAVATEEARVRPAWGAGVALHVALPQGLPPLAVEAESLREALAQLLDNAREAISDEGVVTLSARVVELAEADCQELFGAAASGRHVEVTVTDTGGGLPPEVRRRLFAEFFFSTKVRHRGLGLAVVHGILRTYRGGLRFGPDPAQGTAVRLFLPVAADGGLSEEPTARRQGERVLLVDDDPLILRFMTMVLEGAGYRTESAAGGAEALTRYAAEPFRLVLTDVLMPQMDGFELVRRLRERDPGVNALFISSAESFRVGEDDAVRRFGVLVKPFRPESLLHAVRTALDRRAAPAS
jgi:signal transduction histidine kinase